MLTTRRAAGVAAALLLTIVSACGDDSPSSSPSPAATQSPTSSPAPSPTAQAAATEPPARDLLDLARRFRGYPYTAPETARTEPYNHETGDQEQFTLVDLNETAEYTVSASVRVVTDHAYFFVENGSSVSDNAIGQAAADFESAVWPVITGVFGLPPTPGVDADPRISILHADLRGAGGYVSQSNEYPAAAVPRSAEREILYIDSSALSSPGTVYNSLIAHELQHLIHLAHDPNEEAWVNEGLSEVAWQLAGGETASIHQFFNSPDTQLTTWPNDSTVRVHYASSELFMSYLLDQYGGRANAEVLIDHDENGIGGIEAYLDGFNQSFNDVFADFVVANVLDAPEGPYSHPNFDGTTSAIQDVALGSEEMATVGQYGTDYYRVTQGAVFAFNGEEEVDIGVPANDGAFWWSDRSDGIDSRLTREVDLTDVNEATLEFDLWFDIEEGWDYGYVAVSMDDGRTWVALAGDHTTIDDPVGASYGPGYTGDSGGWVREEIDLSPYAGQKVILRFEYITDDAANLTGMAIDNIAIPQIGLEDSADTESGWDQEGFRRVDGPLKQKFVVQAINPENDRVVRLDLDAENAGVLLVGTGNIIAVSAITPGTTEAASYDWGLQP